MNLRAGADQTASPAACALCRMASSPMAIARAPSTSQVASHFRGDPCQVATMAAATAVRPMVTPPHPAGARP